MEKIHFPAISVVMPVWNGSRYLKEAIDSILAQTLRDFEFLIIDDGSTDETVAIIESYQDPRIRLIRQDHKGIVVALNTGVRNARSNWIARMDADDISKPDRFERQLRALAADPNGIMCYTNFDFLFPDGTSKPIRFFSASEGVLMLQLCFFCPIAHPTVVFRKDVFEACGGYLNEERHAEDFGLWSRFLIKGRSIGIAKSLFLVRRHDESISVSAANPQKTLSNQLSLKNCVRFMHLNDKDAARASKLLRNEVEKFPFLDWIWFLAYCLPRLRKKGIPTWFYCLKLAMSQLLRWKFHF